MSTNTITGVVKSSDLTVLSVTLDGDYALIERGGKFYRILTKDLAPLQVANLPALDALSDADSLVALHEGGFAHIAADKLNLATGQIAGLDASLSNLSGTVSWLQNRWSYTPQLPSGVAAQLLSGHRALTFNSIGLIDYAQPGDAVAGINTSTTNAEVVMYNSGIIEESSWTWTAGAPIYLAADGILTQTAPTSGVLQILGWAMTRRSMLVDIQPSIQLAD